MMLEIKWDFGKWICEQVWSTSMEAKPTTSNSSINYVRDSESRWIAQSSKHSETITRCNDDKTPFELKAKKDKNINYIYDCIIKWIERVCLVSSRLVASSRERDSICIIWNWFKCLSRTSAIAKCAQLVCETNMCCYASGRFCLVSQWTSN